LDIFADAANEPAGVQMSEDIVREFLVESNENIDSLDRDLVQLEKEPNNRERLAAIFRTIHTIKGTCGFLGFTKLESVAHVGENLLSRLRDGNLSLTPEITTALLQLVDAVRQMLQSIEAIGNEGLRDDEELIRTLTLLYRSGTQTQGDQTRETIATVQTTTPQTEPSRSSEAQGNPQPPAATRAPSEAEPTHPESADAAQATNAGRSAVNEGSIRVDVVLLDKLMNLVGELVLARNQIMQFTNTTEDVGIIAPTQRLNLITTELQEGVMKTRMQPIGNIWNKLPRTVRDISASLHKQIRLEMIGQDTELDKTIIEAIKDPLTHIVRNSADHGIELPSARVAAGKPAEGRLVLRAYHEGGQVNIEISDDGRGLDPEKLRRTALEKGLISSEQAGRMNERELTNLIFLPGFSTAEKITNVSGRGVGMDVVKTNIEKIGGTVDLYSRPGVGTTVKMKIPLTLAIIPALIVTSAGDRYAIPQISLLELVRLEEEAASKQIELIQGAPVYRLRGRLLPLVYLNRELHGEAKNSAAGGPVNIVVLQAGDRQFGLVVDGISDTEEIVVKPLGKQLKSAKTFAGCTIMGDGRVALILDVVGLAQACNLAGENRERAATERDAPATAQSSRKQAMLLFQYGKEGRMAMDLSLVARLEEFKNEAVERAGDCHVVQYRGKIMPLIRISEFLQSPGEENGETMQVIVYSEQSRSVGLVVDRILDIVEESVSLEQPSRRLGLLGSAVVQQRVTDMLDVRGLIQSAHPSFFEKVN
jgi:two-component system chemotaxis sensor kinase CheA